MLLLHGKLFLFKKIDGFLLYEKAQGNGPDDNNGDDYEENNENGNGDNDDD